MCESNLESLFHFRQSSNETSNSSNLLSSLYRILLVFLERNGQWYRINEGESATYRDSKGFQTALGRASHSCSLSRSVATIEEVRFASPGIPDSPLNRDHPHELSSRSISSFIYPIYPRSMSRISFHLDRGKKLFRLTGIRWKKNALRLWRGYFLMKLVWDIGWGKRLSFDYWNIIWIFLKMWILVSRLFYVLLFEIVWSVQKSINTL